MKINFDSLQLSSDPVTVAGLVALANKIDIALKNRFIDTDNFAIHNLNPGGSPTDYSSSAFIKNVVDSPNESKLWEGEFVDSSTDVLTANYLKITEYLSQFETINVMNRFEYTANNESLDELSFETITDMTKDVKNHLSKHGLDPVFGPGLVRDKVRDVTTTLAGRTYTFQKMEGWKYLKHSTYGQISMSDEMSTPFKFKIVLDSDDINELRYKIHILSQVDASYFTGGGSITIFGKIMTQYGRKL